MSERKCINCRHRAIKGASDYCDFSGNYRWEKNLEMLKSGALGDVNSPKTLLRYWKIQERAGYPNASENVKYFENMVKKESEDTE